MRDWEPRTLVRRGILALLLVVVGGFMFVIWLLPDAPGYGSQHIYSVMYRAYTDGTKIHVEFVSPGVDKNGGIDVPPQLWNRTVAAAKGDFVTISATDSGAGTCAMCEIWVDDVIWRRRASLGAGTTAVCNGYIGSPAEVELYPAR